MKQIKPIVWLIAGIVLLVLLPPVGVGLLIHVAVTARQNNRLISWVATGILALIFIVLLFIFFLFDNAVQFA